MTPILAQASVPYLEVARLSDIANPLEPLAAEFQIIAYTICFIGFALHIWQHKDSPAPELATFLRLSIIVALIAFLGPITDLLTDIFYYFPEKLIRDGHGINTAGDRIRSLYFALWDEQAKEEPSFMNFLTFSLASFSQAVFSLLFGAISIIGSLILLPIYFLQRFATLLGFAGMPIAFALFSIPAMKDKAANYVLSVLSVLSWPFFLSVVNIAAGAMLDIALANPMPTAWKIFGGGIAPALAALILIGGSMAVPLFSYFLFTTGGGYLPPGTAAQVGNLAGSMGGLKNVMRSFTKGGGARPPLP